MHSGEPESKLLGTNERTGNTHDNDR